MWKKDIWKRIAAFIFCCGIGIVNYRQMIWFHWHEKDYKFFAALWCILIFGLLFSVINNAITNERIIEALFKHLGIDIENKKK